MNPASTLPSCVASETQYTLFGPRGTPYPGHPVVLAYLVMANFASIEDALAVARGKQVRNVFDRPGIPGSIRNIEVALEVLKLARAASVEEALALATKQWDSGSGFTGGGSDWARGTAQALEIWPQLLQRLKTWVLVG